MTFFWALSSTGRTVIWGKIKRTGKKIQWLLSFHTISRLVLFVCLFVCLSKESESEVTQSCLTLATSWTVAYQAPLPMGFSRQEYWSSFQLAICFIHSYIHISTLLSQFVWPSPSPAVSMKLHSMFESLSCPTNRFIIFLVSIYTTHWYTIFVFLFLTYFILYNSMLWFLLYIRFTTFLIF